MWYMYKEIKIIKNLDITKIENEDKEGFYRIIIMIYIAN